MKLIACRECERQWDASRYRPGQRIRCACSAVMEVPHTPSYAPEVLHCEACGAARSAKTGPCQYCGAVPTRDAAKRTLICPFCYHRTADESRFCSSCGKPIQPGDLEASAGDLVCPRCEPSRLINRRIGEFMVDECPDCSGMWVEATAFHRVVNEEVERQKDKLGPGLGRGSPRRYTVPLNEVVYLKCPTCEHRMHRINFARGSGVIVDECREHGVWLDEDELGKIAEYVRSGGLEHARRLEAQDAPERNTPLPKEILRGYRPEPQSHLDRSPLGSILEIVRALFIDL